MKIIEKNIRPLYFLVLCASIGYFFGSLAGGAIAGCMLIAICTFFKN
jgi:hypothetical protein